MVYPFISSVSIASMWCCCFQYYAKMTFLTFFQYFYLILEPGTIIFFGPLHMLHTTNVHDCGSAICRFVNGHHYTGSNYVTTYLSETRYHCTTRLKISRHAFGSVMQSIQKNGTVMVDESWSCFTDFDMMFFI